MTEKQASIIKNTTFLSGAFIIQKILAFIYFVLIARFLEVDEVGKYTFALSFTTIFAVFIDLGLSSVLTRETARDKRLAKNYLSSIFSLKIILSALVYLAVVIVVNLMNYPTLTKQLVYISGIVMFIDSFTLSVYAIFRGLQRLKYEALGIILNQVIIVVFGITILYLSGSVRLLISVFLLGSIFNLIYSATLLYKKANVKFTLSFDKKLLQYLFKLSAPFAVMGIFTRIYSNIDAVLISKLIGDKFLGFYSVAYKIPFALQFIPSAFAASLYPAMSKFFVKSKSSLQKTFEKAMFFLMIFSVPIAMGIFSLSDQIITKFYGSEYESSIIVLQVLILGLVFIFLNFPIGSLMNACNYQTINTILLGVTMIINIIANLILLPRYGIVGAAIAFLCSHGFMFVSGLIVANRIIKYDKIFLLIKFLKTILAAALMVVSIYIVKDYYHLAVSIMIGGVVYAFILFIIKGFTKSDVMILYNSFFKKK